jgi:Tol biopolymer transport system component
MKIVEGVLFNEYHRDFEEFILGPYMPWYFNEATTDNEIDNLYQFTHTIINHDTPRNLTAEFDKLLMNIFIGVGIENPRIKRVKFNLLSRQPYTEKDLEFSIHQDFPDCSNLNSLIYYPHDSDGDTVIYKADGTATNITPKANTAVIFDSLLKHRATPPTINRKRIVLNIVYYR